MCIAPSATVAFLSNAGRETMSGQLPCLFTEPNISSQINIPSHTKLRLRLL